MSYNVHVTKSLNWWHSEQHPITEADLEQVKSWIDLLPITYTKGRLTLEGANNEVMGILIAIAEQIGARVQGDEGEVYEGDYPIDPQMLAELERSKSIYVSPELPATNEYIESIIIGSELLHPKYGPGTVMEIINEQTDKELIVFFPSIGATKQILAYYAKLNMPNK
ncbi:hypothetical protein [Paenibacillus bovis]|uniref:Uncharacterized protein n=1 Tax=Paenibacillus bovis TaxID=1616788 RepID=A0A172ZJP6_9BACL|nr:hypothetical protein [Paenibacillus bovis]ANF97866.1 hypothetical protein AR543_18830 [Paenibacillus bovis]